MGATCVHGFGEYTCPNLGQGDDFWHWQEMTYGNVLEMSSGTVLWMTSDTVLKMTSVTG